MGRDLQVFASILAAHGDLLGKRCLGRPKQRRGGVRPDFGSAYGPMGRAEGWRSVGGPNFDGWVHGASCGTKTACYMFRSTTCGPWFEYNLSWGPLAQVLAFARASGVSAPDNLSVL